MTDTTLPGMTGPIPIPVAAAADRTKNEANYLADLIRTAGGHALRIAGLLDAAAEMLRPKGDADA